MRAGTLVIPEEELRERFSRSSGPGGQGVNTTDSRVELRWDVMASTAVTDLQRVQLLDRLRLVDGVLVVVASEFRAQLRNREAARSRMVDVVTAALRPAPPPRRPTKPSRAARERRLAGKRLRSGVKRGRGRVDPDS